MMSHFSVLTRARKEVRGEGMTEGEVELMVRGL